MTIQQKSAFKKKGNWYRDYTNDFLKHLKLNSTSDFLDLVILVKNVKIKNVWWLDWMVYFVKKRSIPICQKCSISLGLVIRDQNYCWPDCHLGERITGDSYPYKFVTFYENEE